jgi:hypothetical protein
MRQEAYYERGFQQEGRGSSVCASAAPRANRFLRKLLVTGSSCQDAIHNQGCTMMHVIHRSIGSSFSIGLGCVNLVFPFLFEYIEQGIFNWLNARRLFVSEHEGLLTISFALTLSSPFHLRLSLSICFRSRHTGWINALQYQNTNGEFWLTIWPIAIGSTCVFSRKMNQRFNILCLNFGSLDNNHEVISPR